MLFIELVEILYFEITTPNSELKLVRGYGNTLRSDNSVG